MKVWVLWVLMQGTPEEIKVFESEMECAQALAEILADQDQQGSRKILNGGCAEAPLIKNAD